MHTLILHTPKGGSGKSTLSRELAVALGEGAVLADMDPQQTTAGWYRRRARPHPLVIPAGALHDRMDLEDAGARVLVVDTAPGAPSRNLEQAFRTASAVLVPVRPTPDDLLGAAPIAATLQGCRAWAFVITQAPVRSRLTESAVRSLAALGRVAPVHVHFRADYPAAAIDGTTAYETPGSKAGQEIAQLRDYALTLMRMNDGH